MEINFLKNIDLIYISEYLDNIKKNAYKDVAHIQNNVLNKSPYTSNFIEKCIFRERPIKINIFFKIKNILYFYFKNILYFFVYVVNFTIFKFLWKKKKNTFDKGIYIVDIFFIVEKIINNGEFKDNFFYGLYEILDKYNKEFAFLPRLHGVEKNPIKFVQFIRVINKDISNKYIFEYELLSCFDLVKIFIFIIKYPIKQFSLIQKERQSLDVIFNYEIFNSLPNTTFDAYIRYIVGKKLSTILPDKSIILSWQEFQNIERTFYRAINESENGVCVYGCELLVKYNAYMSMHITDVDVELLVTPYKVLLNGKYNYSTSSLQKFSSGVSLRYGEIFNYHSHDNCNNFSFLALLGYDVKLSQKLLKIVNGIDTLKIKLHPTTNESQFYLYNNKKWVYAYGGLYDITQEAKLVFTTVMSGTSLEVVSCGIPVVIVKHSKELDVSPLLEFGKGKIWDFASNQNELIIKSNALLEYKKNNLHDFYSISRWYRDNFFIKPTEKNIVDAFNIN